VVVVIAGVIVGGAASAWLSAHGSGGAAGGGNSSGPNARAVLTKVVVQPYPEGLPTAYLTRRSSSPKGAPPLRVIAALLPAGPLPPPSTDRACRRGLYVIISIRGRRQPMIYGPCRLPASIRAVADAATR
jgi:hypothetical protein